MKRDARIGLAVVLVLGLGVTLLVGRAIYKRGGPTADGDGEQFASGTLQQGDHDDAGNPAGANLFGPRDDAHGASSGTAQPAAGAAVPPGAESFIQQQTGPVSNEKKPQGISKPAGEPAGEPDDSAPIPGRPGRKSDSVQTSTEFRSYTVANGDSPWSISSKIFGDGKYTQKIIDANDLSTKKMKVGMALKIPSIPNKPMIVKLPLYTEPGAAHAAHESGATKPAPASTTGENHPGGGTAKATVYKVETGDTISTIAKKHYGSNGPKTVQLIVAANHGLDPAKLKVGQELALPAVK